MRGARHDLLAHPVDVVGDLGNQDDVRAPRHTGVQRDESRLATHHFHHHDAVMALGRGVQLVDRLERGVDGRVEAERGDGAADVVVDRLRNADDLHALGAELVGDVERSVAADGDDRVDPENPRVLDQFIGAVDIHMAAIRLLSGIEERVAPVGGAKDRPAEMRDAAHRILGERHDLVFAEQSGEAALDAKDIPAAVDGREHGGTNDRVETRSVAATGGKGNAHSEGRETVVRTGCNVRWVGTPQGRAGPTDVTSR